MLKFQEYISLFEAMPPAGGAPPMGGPPGGGLGAPPMGAPPGGGMPPPMGGMPGAPPAGGNAPVSTKEVTPLDVWRVIERILEGKPANLKKPTGQEGGDSVDSTAQPNTGAPPGMAPQPMAPPGAAVGQAPTAPPQHLLGTPM